MVYAINSPFRYAGGKFYARKLILQCIPRHEAYIEPFAGGASIFFAKPKVKHNWLNDIDKELINCLVCIRDFPSELVQRLRGERATKERHFFYKNIFKPKNKLERAVRWFYLNRTSYSGIMNMQNCFFGYGEKYSKRPENWPRTIMDSSNKLRGVRLTSQDFEVVIDKSPPGSFLFIDPPYFNADQDKFYTHKFIRKDHDRLVKTIRRNGHRLKFLLTYDNSDEIKKLYSWATIILEREWNYTINRTDDQTKDGRNGGNGIKRRRYKGQELFIMNYEPNVFVQERLIDEKYLFI
jgi:DNA adenine methylase